MNRTENRICWYSSLLIAILLNSPRLLALRTNGMVGQYWAFNFSEWTFQVIYNLAFCVLLCHLYLKKNRYLPVYRGWNKNTFYLVYSTLIVFGSIVLGTVLQRTLFNSQAPRGMVGSGYFIRLVLSIILISIVVRIITLMRNAEKKELENQQLKSNYMLAELELLKEQINPHLLFNSLSSLSAVIREDTELAQKYLKDLSQVLRYAITQSKANLVTLETELAVLNSFAHLITMRLENAFILDVKVQKPYLSYQLPHLSIQPLLENAVKHNAATATRPLSVIIDVQENYVVVSNSLFPIPTPESSNGTGLVNLNERFRIMMQHEIEIIQTAEQFIVKLPLKAWIR